MKSEDSSKIAFGCLTFLVLPPFIAWRSFVITKLWAWFVVAQFDAKPLTMPVAYGLCLAVMVIMPKLRDSDDPSLRTSAEKFASMITSAAVGPAVALVVGWIVRGFI